METDEGIEIERSEEQPLKVESLISVTEEGIEISTSEKHLLKA